MGRKSGDSCMTTIYFIRHAEPDYSNHSDVPLLMPWIVKFTFDDEKFMGIEKIEVRRSR